MNYKKGLIYAEQFGEYGDKIDAFGFCLFGDINHLAAQFETAPVVADHQKISFCFRFAVIKPYGEIIQLLDKLMAELDKAGWKAEKSVEGYPDTGCSVNDLADTQEIQYYGTPEADFPSKPNVEGFNAAGGFTVVVEKPGTKPEFTEEEIQEIRRIAKEFGCNIYGREIEEVKS